MKDSVSLRACDNYESNNVDIALEAAIHDLGGIGAFVRPGMRVLVKANLVMKKYPDQHATTHPQIIASICRLVTAAGGEAIIADSPGGPFTETALRIVYNATGMSRATEESGAKLSYDTRMVDVEYADGRVLKKMKLCGYLDGIDLVISAAKLKTHSMTGFSGAVKNMFGAVPGMIKFEYHYKMPELKNFSDMLLDVACRTRPELAIIDGIWGMEGEGPTAGDPRKVGVIIASANMHAADIAGSYIIGMDPSKVCTIQRAVERGIVSGDICDLELLGDPVEGFVINDYKAAPTFGTTIMRGNLPGFLASFIEKRIECRPQLKNEGCIGCNDCMRSCPAKAIEMRERRPAFDYSSCIRCYCCQELCPQGAIGIKRSWLLRLFDRF